MLSNPTRSVTVIILFQWDSIIFISTTITSRLKRKRGLGLGGKAGGEDLGALL